ncbi:hypothetical protein [Paenibacillus polymyxa]|uniref:hypothetical protein n=1 Tax=Paenibacillus polymyxa TaxID=1406 RepID=UPI00298C86D8|nr:hypothetical protein [Paenibacillus polymyxa]
MGQPFFSANGCYANCLDRTSMARSPYSVFLSSAALFRLLPVGFVAAGLVA